MCLASTGGVVMNKGKSNTAHLFTKEVLFLALCRLMAVKSIDEITIKELAQEAGVSRTTFYRNYKDIEDILLDYYRNHPFGSLSTEDYEPEKFDLIRCLRYSLNEIKTHSAVWVNLLNSDNDFIVYRIFDETIKNTCRDRAFDIGFRSEYELSAFVGIYYSICHEWIKRGMKESVNEMIDIAYSIIHQFYKNDEYAIPERDDVYQL